MKIHKIQGDISSDVANSFKDSVAIDTEATGLLIPERDKLSLVQICKPQADFFSVSQVEVAKVIGVSRQAIASYEKRAINKLKLKMAFAVA